MRRFWIMLLAVALALVIAPPVGAGKPDPTKPFTFVAMPHSFDDRQNITFTVTPCTTPYCG